MRPMLGWEVVKGKEHFFIFLQAFAGFWEFDLVTRDELIVSRQNGFASRRQVHFMDQLLSFALNTLRHFIQDVGGLMNPATLLGHWAIFLLQSDPEAQRSITDSQLRWGRQAQAFELPNSSRQDWALSQ